MGRRATLSSFIALALLGIVATLPARAMEFTDKRIDNGLVMIRATGEIQLGDTDRLMSVLVILPAKEHHVLALDSPGGNIVASQSLAATIKQAGLGVFVGNVGVCASACFLLYAAGTSKFYMPGAKIGVHSAIGGGYETPGSMAMTTVMARTAADLGVPDAIVGRMIRTPPGAIAWLSNAELASMGAVNLDADTGPAKPPPMASVSPPAPAPAPPAVALAQPVRPGSVPADSSSASYQRGLSERSTWELWFAGLSGDYRDGAEFWTGERSKPRPRNCNATVADYTRGCLEAKRLLTASDYLRKNDPQYWWGWNSYAVSTPASAPTPAPTPTAAVSPDPAFRPAPDQPPSSDLPRSDAECMAGFGVACPAWVRRKWANGVAR